MDLEHAFGEWNELLYKYVYVRIQDQGISEDIVQEAFFKAWTKRETFDPKKSSLKNWLFVITINLVRDHYRSKKSHQEEILDEGISDTTDIHKSLEEKNLLEFILMRMHELPERDQELIHLRYTQDLSLQEISEVMKMNYSAAKVALHRALQKLKTICQKT